LPLVRSNEVATSCAFRGPEKGIADRAVRRLGLGLDCKPKTAEPTLAQYLATRQPAAEQLEEAGTTATESDSSAPSANDVGEHGAPE
jgi:hypothetical protein